VVARANANADVSGPVVGLPDGTIDMRDVSVVARYFALANFNGERL